MAIESLSPMPFFWDLYSAQPLEGEDNDQTIDKDDAPSQKEAQGLSAKGYHACMRAVHAEKQGILGYVAFLKKDTPKSIDLREVGESIQERIQASAPSFYKAGNTEQLDLLDKNIAAFSLKVPSEPPLKSVSKVLKVASSRVMDFLIHPAGASEQAPVCQRPVYSEAEKDYEKVESMHAVKSVIGGKVKENLDTGAWINSCSARISYIANRSGCKIPRMPGKTVSGKNGEQYIYRLIDLRPFLKKVYGPPDCEWHKRVLTKSSNQKMCHDLSKLKGIIVEKWDISSTCTGHAEVTDMILYPPQDALFWQLPQTEESS